MSRLRASPHLPARTVARARSMRREPTDAEARLWYALREIFPAARFRRQAPFGSYFADFASHGAKLVVEVDGGQHAEAADQDEARTRFLNGEGYRVLRVWNNQVLGDLDGVLRAIAEAIPSPLVGEGGPTGRMRGARRSRASASKADTPHSLLSPTRGERGSDKPTVWSL